MIGQKFNRWTVIGDAGRDKGCRKRWLCRCECGTVREVRGDHLVRNYTKSCGCYAKESTSLHKKIHGLAKTRIHNVWINMRSRCENKSNNRYYRYGARGIKVCERWQSFMNFYSDMGDLPFPGAQIDRIDNNGNYEPSNCRWVTASANGLNKSNNQLITFNSVTLTATEWAQKMGLTYTALHHRLSRGWDICKALTTPMRGTQTCL